MNQIRELGQNGEELAATYLMNRGYRILHRNWNLHRGCELDIGGRSNGQILDCDLWRRNCQKLNEDCSRDGILVDSEMGSHGG